MEAIMEMEKIDLTNLVPGRVRSDPPHSEEEISEMTRFSAHATARQYSAENTKHMLKEELGWIKEDVNILLQNPDINIKRYKFLTTVKDIVNKYLIGDDLVVINFDFDDHINLILWYIDRKLHHLMEIEIDVDANGNECIVPQIIRHSSEADVIMTLIKIINKIGYASIDNRELMELLRD